MIQTSYRSPGDSTVTQSDETNGPRASRWRGQAAATASRSMTTRTLRPRRSSRMVTRSLSVMPSNRPRQAENTPSTTRTFSPRAKPRRAS